MARNYRLRRAIAIGPGRKPKNDSGLVEVVRIAVEAGMDLNDMLRRAADFLAGRERITQKSARERLGRAYRARYGNEAGK